MRFASDLERQLQGYGLTTAHILYRIPDFESVLQTYVWQDYDLAPDHPKLFEFIEFWQREIEGPLHSVRVASAALWRPAEFLYVDGQFTLQ